MMGVLVTSSVSVGGGGVWVAEGGTVEVSLGVGGRVNITGVSVGVIVADSVFSVGIFVAGEGVKLRAIALSVGLTELVGNENDISGISLLF